VTIRSTIPEMSRRLGARVAARAVRPVSGSGRGGTSRPRAAWSRGPTGRFKSFQRSAPHRRARVDLFGSRGDPQPRPVAKDADHPFVFTRWMPGKRGHRLVYRGPGWNPGGMSATFAFQSVTHAPASIFESVGWGSGTDGGTGWRVMRPRPGLLQGVRHPRPADVAEGTRRVGLRATNGVGVAAACG
jgi:hypothetical protein